MKFTRHILFMRRALGTAVIALGLFSAFAHASATLFLEEPYGKLGFFTATGHAAVYLSGVCAETPVKAASLCSRGNRDRAQPLRRCRRI